MLLTAAIYRSADLLLIETPWPQFMRSCGRGKKIFTVMPIQTVQALMSLLAVDVFRGSKLHMEAMVKLHRHASVLNQPFRGVKFCSRIIQIIKCHSAFMQVPWVSRLSTRY